MTGQTRETMDCKHVNDHLIDYLYQELEADQLDQFEGHIKSCDGCASELAAFESTRSAMRELPEVEPPPALSQVLMREAARAVTPVEQQGFWERLRAGMRMMVMHPAMTAAVVLVVVVGISFMVYRGGGPPSLEPRADDLPPVPPSAATATAKAGGAVELATAPQRLKEEERSRDETVADNNADNNKAGQLKHVAAQTKATGLEGKIGEATADQQKAQGRLANALGAADTAGRPNDHKDAPRADKSATALPLTTRGRRTAKARAAKARPAVARRAAYRGKGALSGRGPVKQGPAGTSATRSLKGGDNSDDLLSDADLVRRKKKGLGSYDSLRSSGSGGDKYAKAPPPQAKPRTRPRRRARRRPKPAAKYAYAPKPRPRAPMAEPAAEAAPRALRPAPRPTKTPAPQAARAHDADHWVGRGDLAMKKGDCPAALSFYNRAVGIQPGLSKKVGGMVRRCVTNLGRGGEKQLMLAAKRYPRLAGYFSREIRKQRAEARARANREAGAPYSGKRKASKRRSKARKGQQSKPRKGQQSRPAQVDQAPAAK